MTVINRNIDITADATLPGMIRQLKEQYDLNIDANEASNTKIDLGGLGIGGDEGAAEEAVATARLNGVIVAYRSRVLNGARNWENFRVSGPTQAVIWLLEDLLLEH